MGFMDNVMGSFNDEAGKINTGTGQYRVMQVVLREKFVGKGSKNFAEIEELCNQQYAEGYRLHTFAQSTAGSTGLGGGDRTVCNLVFERMRAGKLRAPAHTTACAPERSRALGGASCLQPEPPRRVDLQAQA